MADDAFPPTLPKHASDEVVASAGLSGPRQWVELHGNYLFQGAQAEKILFNQLAALLVSGKGQGL